MPAPVHITNGMLQDATDFVDAHDKKWYARLGKSAVKVIGAMWYENNGAPEMHVQLRDATGKPLTMSCAEFEREYTLTKAIK